LIGLPIRKAGERCVAFKDGTSVRSCRRDLAPCLERLGGRHVLAGDKGRELFVPRYLEEFGYDRAARRSFGEPGTFSTTGADIAIGLHTFKGDLDTYRIHVDANDTGGLGCDLVLQRRVPSYRPGFRQGAHPAASSCQ
jgi:hypothetical protein